MSELYRYRLTRTFTTGNGPVVFVMLNPSTADEARDDPTIRRCIGFASRLRYRELRVVNLFARRSTNPRGLLDEPDGPPTADEEKAWDWAFDGYPTVIAAWGAPSGALAVKVAKRRPFVFAAAQRNDVWLHALGITKGGHPRHPLYLPADADLVPFYPETVR